MKVLIITKSNATITSQLLANEIYQSLYHQEKMVGKIISSEKEFEGWRSKLLEISPDIIITIDLAGFDLYDAKKEIAYNFLYCKCIHILTKEPWYYPDELLCRVNFNSTFFVISERDADYMRRYYENIPQIKKLDSFTQLDLMADTCFDREDVICADYESLEDIKARLTKLPEGFSTMAIQLWKEWSTDKAPYLPDGICSYLNYISCPYKDEEVTEMSVLLKDIPYYYEMKHLLDYIKNNTDKGIHICVCGAGWEEFTLVNKDYFHIVNNIEENKTIIPHYCIQSIIDCIRCGYV